MVNNQMNAVDTTAPATAMPVKKKTARVDRIPTRESDLSTLCRHVAAEWLQDPSIVWSQMTSQQFDVLSAQYAGLIGNRHSAVGVRHVKTNQIMQLDNEFDAAIRAIKYYLTIKYANQAYSHYAKFGVVKYKTRYILPRNRDERVAALPLIINSIQEYGFQQSDYGLAWWNDFQLRYTSVTTVAYDADTQIHDAAGNKKSIRTELTVALRVIIRLIQIQYVGDAEMVLLKWGFRRANY